MASRWPEFEFEDLRDSLVSWTGPLRGLQKPYLIAVYWNHAREDKPYVVLREPHLYPREGKSFEEIPHLIFNSELPELSGLCLFDPEGKEWSNKLLIADTTVPWAAEWLGYYELWHLDGVWRGSGVGPESVAEARATALYRATGQFA